MGTPTIIVEPHRLVRTGVRHILEDQRRACTVVGEAPSMRQALAMPAASMSELVITSLELPDGDGLQLCRELRTRNDACACVILAMAPNLRFRLSAALAGVGAIVDSRCTSDELAEVVDAVVAGQRLSGQTPAILDQLVEEGAGDPVLSMLTQRERYVFELVGQGLTNRAIADYLGLAPSTVRNVLSSVLDKLGARRRTQVVARAATLANSRTVSRWDRSAPSRGMSSAHHPQLKRRRRGAQR